MLEVPVFRRLERIEGDLDALLARLRQLVVDQSQAWLELVYTGEAIVADLREILEDAIVGSDLEILRVKNTRLVERFLGQLQVDETLDEMDVDEVFRRCLQLHEIPPSQWSELERSFHETLASLQNADSRAE